MEYSRNFGSDFPNAFIPVGNKKDVDHTVVNLINQYYSYIDSGNISGAKSLYEDNKDEHGNPILEPYMINMAYINRLEEEIFNTGLSVLKISTNIINNTEPLDQPEDGYWYTDY